MDRVSKFKNFDHSAIAKKDQRKVKGGHCCDEPPPPPPEDPKENKDG